MLYCQLPRISSLPTAQSLISADCLAKNQFNIKIQFIKLKRFIWMSIYYRNYSVEIGNMATNHNDLLSCIQKEKKRKEFLDLNTHATCEYMHNLNYLFVFVFAQMKTCLASYSAYISIRLLQQQQNITDLYFKNWIVSANERCARISIHIITKQQQPWSFFYCYFCWFAFSCVLLSFNSVC